MQTTARDYVTTKFWTIAQNLKVSNLSQIEPNRVKHLKGSFTLQRKRGVYALVLAILSQKKKKSGS